MDFGCLCDRHADDALEFMAKAIGDDPADGWDPHANPYLRALVETFTRRGLLRFDSVRRELEAWLSGRLSRPTVKRPARPSLLMQRWSAAELELTALYLSSLPRDAFTLADWNLVVDYVVQKYLPFDDMRTDAEWLATRAALAGRVEASLGEVPLGEAETLVTSLPVDPASIERELGGLSSLQRAVIEFGRERAAENVRGITDTVRHRMRQIIVDHQEAAYLGDKAGSAESVQSKLLDAFGKLNRDWRRIAVTEATEISGQGYVASCKPGEKIKRVEKYRGACDFCRSINGAVLTVVDPGKADKNWDTEVWVGKTNIGRSAAARKRVNGGLVEREPEERYAVAAGAMHPHCRGSWVKVVPGASEDPTFEAWLKKLRKEPSGG